MRDLADPAYAAFMRNLNAFAGPLGLHQFIDRSKVWEYPWLWFNALGRIGFAGARVIDLGSQSSPMPWAMAVLGAHVTLVEASPSCIPIWRRAKDRLGVRVDWVLTDSHRIPLDDGAADVVTSFSVIEHQPDKPGAVAEAARVLRPGGLFALSFDICEPDMGMTFPDWNGRALTLHEFEGLVWRHPALNAPEPPGWNLEDIPGFLTWHRTTAPHHNYVVGAAVLRKAPAPVP